MIVQVKLSENLCNLIARPSLNCGEVTTVGVGSKRVWSTGLIDGIVVLFLCAAALNQVRKVVFRQVIGMGCLRSLS